MRLDGSAWRTFFDGFEQEAFRLETLPVYDMTSEQQEYRTFLQTGELDIPDDDQWLTRVRYFRSTGRWVGRVHVLTQPLNDYLRYEFAVYRHTVRAGEDVRILDATGRHDTGLPPQDFWLFDESAVVLMDYRPGGVQIGRELLEGADPEPYIGWKRLALEQAIPFEEYVTLHQCD